MEKDQKRPGRREVTNVNAFFWVALLQENQWKSLHEHWKIFFDVERGTVAFWLVRQASADHSNLASTYLFVHNLSNYMFGCTFHLSWSLVKYRWFPGTLEASLWPRIQIEFLVKGWSVKVQNIDRKCDMHGQPKLRNTEKNGGGCIKKTVPSC